MLTNEAVQKKWFVLYTKPNSEKKVAERLERLNIQVYLPVRTELRQWSDRKKKVNVCVLPSMVLVCLEEKDAAVVFDVPGVVRYLFEQGNRAVIRDEEILAMQAYLEGGLLKERKGLQVGDTVEVPHLQHEATVVALQGKKCLARLERLGAVVSFQLQS
ncbi:MAG: transcription termination/antitermination NusG family protein [Polaribacter sp.]